MRRTARSASPASPLVGAAALASAIALVAAPSAAQEYRYDAAGRLVHVTYDDDSTAAFEYDQNGNLVGVTRSGVPEGATTGAGATSGAGPGSGADASSGSTPASAGASGAGGADGASRGEDDGCGCELVGAAPTHGAAGPALLGLLGVAALRARARRRPTRSRGAALPAAAATVCLLLSARARAQSFDFTIDFGTTLGLGVGTSVTTQFQPMGVHFTGADGGPAFIVDDPAVPNTPVLAGTQSFYQGPIVVRFVDPVTGLPAPVATAGALATGYFDNLLSTEMRAYAADGALLGSKRNRGIGVEALVMERGQADIARVEFIAVEKRGAGFAIDHVIARAAARPTTSANHISSLTMNDPIDTFTGELVLDAPADLDLGGPLPVRFARYYAAGLDRAGMSGAAGASWRHTYDWSISVQGSVAEVISDRGRRISFARGAAWSLIGRTDIPFQMWESADHHHVLDPRTDLVYGFSRATQKLETIERRGRAITLSWSGDRLASVTDGVGRTLTFTHGADDLLDAVTDGTRVVELEHDGDGDLVEVRDASGGATTYTYAPGHMLVTSTLPEGNRPYSQTWDPGGRVTTQEDANGATWSLTYDPGETTIVDPSGEVVVHRYGGDGELLEWQSEDGLVAQTSYDLDGQRSAVIDRMGDTTATTWHFPSGKIETATDATGAVTSYSYTTRLLGGVVVHDLSGVTHPDGSFESRWYDDAGRPLGWAQPGGATWTYAWEDGLLTRVVNPLGGVLSHAYGALDLPVSTTDPAGNETTYEWDELGRLARIEHPDGTSRRFAFDERDRLTQIIDERGGTSAWAYDANGDPIARTDALGNTTSWARDDMRRRVSETDPRGRTTWSGTWDERGALLSSEDGTGVSSSFEHDERGRLVAVIDGAGETWTREWDDEGLLIGLGDPLGNVSEIERDAAGRITAITSPAGQTTTFELDAVGRVTAATEPDGGTTIIQYDAAGHVASILEEEGIGGAWVRDGLGQPTITYDGLGNPWTQTFDGGGRLLARTDPLARTTGFSYDERNRTIRVDHPDGGGVDLAYDAASNPVRRTYDDGLEIELDYDLRGSITRGPGLELGWDEMGRMVESNGLEIERDAAGRVTSVRYAPGREVEYAYDGRGQLSSIQDWVGGETSFEYDAAGRLVELRRPNGTTARFTWDDDSQLARIEEEGLSSIALSRDPVGRVTRATRDVPLAADAALVTPIALTYDAAAQVATFSYDPLGRLVDDGSTTFAWDGASRLVSRTASNGTSSFTYDALGLRTSRAVDGEARELVWNYAMGLPVIALERSGGEDLRSWVHTPGGALLYAVDADDRRHFHHFDENGNTIYLTDDAGAIEAAWAYGPYGSVRASTEVDNPFTWQGQLGALDEGGGLFTLRVRWYDATTARFLSRDPLPASDVRSLNPYSYAGQDPLRFVDPMGTDRRVVFSGHTWLVVDTYDADGKKNGELSLHFSPSGWTTNLPRQDYYPDALQYTIPSSREADEKLLALWRYNARKNEVHWNPSYNCIVATMQFRDYGIAPTPEVPYHPSQGPLAGPDDSDAGRAEMDRRFGLAWANATTFGEHAEVWKDYQKYRLARFFGLD